MEKNDEVLFKVFAGGPLKVTGPVRIKGSDGKIIYRDGPVYFCRCGQSTNKPFCSSAHKQCSFSE
jgi:CDGSH-type Zn-finger protein